MAMLAYEVYEVLAERVQKGNREVEARRFVTELHLLGWAWGENGYWFVSRSCGEQLSVHT